MKEAVGGTWIFTIVIVMISLFTAFISISTNYSRTFKVKDKIIAILEDKRGINHTSISRINSELNKIGYNSTGKCIPSNAPAYAYNAGEWYAFSRNNDNSVVGENSGQINYCIKVTNTDMVSASGVSSGAIGHPARSYFTVMVFFKLDIPVLRDVFALQISGETSSITNAVVDSDIVGN